jgi:hypothetical protein
MQHEFDRERQRIDLGDHAPGSGMEIQSPADKFRRISR